jgi:transcriptional regulatory protein RtcR
MSNKHTVAIGFIGATLDRVGKGANRWSHWRPALACANSKTC